jgi:hypothetical protein
MRVHTLLAILGLGVSSLVWAVNSQEQFENSNNWHREFNVTSPETTPASTDTIGAATTPMAPAVNGSEQDLFENNNGWHTHFNSRQ